MSLLPRRRRRSAPRPSAAPLCWPRGPGNSQMGRYHPLRDRRGGLTGAPPSRPPRSRMSHARLPAGSRSRRRQQGDPVAVASRRPTAAPAPSPGRPDGSLRGAHWGQQVSLQARAPGKRCELRVVLRWELGAGLLTLRSRAHPVRTLFGEVCRASSTLFR